MSDDLKIYKFITENNLEHRWCDKDFILWIPFYLLDDFLETMGRSYFWDDGGYEVRLQDGQICLELNDICEYYGIELENIFEKE